MNTEPAYLLRSTMDSLLFDIGAPSSSVSRRAISETTLPLSGAGPSRLQKVDRAPKRAAVGASHHSPKCIAVRWRPWLAVRAIASDGMYNDHRRFPARCWRAARPWRAPPMLAPGEVGAEEPI